MKIDNSAQYAAKVAWLKKMSTAYYTDDAPIASDSEYDALYHAVLEYEEAHKGEIDSTSPTQKVGAATKEGLGKLAHIERMWSLEDVFNEGDLKAWLGKVERQIMALLDPALSAAPLTYMLSPKYDGVSLNLLYVDGKLQSAITRGDGLLGEDVLANAKVITSVPLNINYKEKIEIRGEVVMEKSAFSKLNLRQEELGLPLFANPRNAAAGSLRLQDASITKQRNLRFVIWGIGHGLDALASRFGYSISSAIEFINTLGFSSSGILHARDIPTLLSYYHEIINKRHSMDIMLDGMVIAIDDVRVQRGLGFNIKAPKFACAFKFPAVEKTTRLLAVMPQVGRSGAITPVAHLDPVEIEGAMISRATLHNYAEIERKDLRINDFVIVIRSGDVIPKIIKSLPLRRDASVHAVIAPTTCPRCDTPLLIEDIERFCVNLSCPARRVASIIYFASKAGANIDGLGAKVVERLYELGKITTIKSLYELNYSDLASLEGFKQRRIDNLLNAIDKSRGLSMWRFINALGIEHIGEGAAKALEKAYGLKALGELGEFVKALGGDLDSKIESDFDSMIETAKAAWLDSLPDYINIDGFGVVMSESMGEFCSINARLIASLYKDLHPSTTIYKDPRNTTSLFHSTTEATKSAKPDITGMTFVLTGDMPRPRGEIKDALEAREAKVTSKVTKKTDFLVCADSDLDNLDEGGAKQSSKLKDALRLGVPILGFDAFAGKFEI